MILINKKMTCLSLFVTFSSKNIGIYKAKQKSILRISQLV